MANFWLYKSQKQTQFKPNQTQNKPNCKKTRNERN
jgi:hypothetical protein